MAMLVVAGTFLPLVGVGLTAALALVLTGRGRWVALALGPAVTGLACYAAAPAVLEGGNLLAAIIYLLYAVALMAYYPALALAAVIVWLRARRPPV
jgi:hypothetical protein